MLSAQMSTEMDSQRDDLHVLYIKYCSPFGKKHGIPPALQRHIHARVAARTITTVPPVMRSTRAGCIIIESVDPAHTMAAKLDTDDALRRVEWIPRPVKIQSSSPWQRWGR